MKKMTWYVVLCLCLFACSNKPHEGQGQSIRNEIVDEFVRTIEKDLTDDGINGSVSFVIFKEKDTLGSYTFGYSNKAANQLANSQTIYRIGSLTKSLTGFLMLKMNQKGILGLDEPVEKYLPEIKLLDGYENHNPITFRQLASHTSGLAREPRTRKFNSGPVSKWQETVLGAIPLTSFVNKPGERFRYSNIGYAILGLAISRAANMPYVTLVENEILLPLEMKNTFFELPVDKKFDLARGIAGGPTAQLNTKLPLEEHQGRGYRVPNGGLYSTPEDMVKFLQACMGYYELLDSTHKHLIQSTQTPTKRLRSNYSFGLDLFSDNQINTARHSGSTPGYSSHFEFDLASQYGIVIMRNYNFGNSNLDLRSLSIIRKLSSIVIAEN